MNELLLGIAIACTILCSITAIFSVLAYCKVVGLENSTHQVQWMHADTPESAPKNNGESAEPSELAKQFAEHVYPDINDEQV